MRAYEAARILWRHRSYDEAKAILQKIWETRPRVESEDEFRIFCALVEIWVGENARAARAFLDSVIFGEGDLAQFWERRSMAEQAVLLDWHGQLAHALGDTAAQLESLSRAASQGRDTSLLWRLLGAACIELGDLELGLRYMRRSLHLHRQLGLELMSGGEHPLGAFTGKHPLGLTHDLNDYLAALLAITRLAKGQRSLKSVRELVVEMIHQFPEESRLLKIRLLLEKTIVEHSLGYAKTSAPAAALQH